MRIRVNPFTLASSIISGAILTLNPNNTPVNSSFSLSVSNLERSFLLISPNEAEAIGILFSSSKWRRASKPPIVSALIITPCSCSVKESTSPTCCCTSCFRRSTSSAFPEELRKGMPAIAVSNPGAEILTPVAAITSLTFLNLLFFSRISANSAGSKRARIFVTIGCSKFPMIKVSFTRNFPL